MVKRTLLMLAIGALACAGAAHGETQWWDAEWDCSVAPDQATPPWSAGPGDASTDGDIWTQPTDGKWTGEQIEWENVSATVEIRFRFNGVESDGVIFNSLPKQWQAITQPGDDSVDMLNLAGGGGGVFEMDEDWNILRLLYDGAGATVYLLSGGELSGNGGAWTQTEIDNPLNVIVFAPPSYVPITSVASGPSRRKVTLANGPVPEVCSTTWDTPKARPSDVPPSVIVKSKMSSAAPADDAVDANGTGSPTAPDAVSVPSVSPCTSTALL